MAETTLRFTAEGFDTPGFDETRLSDVVSTVAPVPPLEFGPMFTLAIEPDASFDTEDLLFSYNRPESRQAGANLRPIILNMGHLETNLNDGSGMFGPRLIPTVGEIDLDLDDGKNSDLCGFNWLDKFYQVSTGWRTRSRRQPGSVTPVIQGRTRDATWTWDRLTIKLRDESEQFKDRPDSGKYLGTGGLEGMENLKDQYKPILIGFKRQASPVLVDKTLNIYQMHFGVTFAIQYVYENLAPLQTLGDISGLGYPTIQNWPEVPGRFVTDLRTGLFRLGAPAQGKITAWAWGHSGGTPIELFRQFLTLYAPTVPVNQNTFTLLDPDNRFTSGVYLPPNDSRSLADIFDRLAASINAYWAFSSLGTLEIYPTRFSPQSGVITEDETQRTLRRVSGSRPVWQVRMHYAHNADPNRDSEISPTGVFTNDFPFALQEWMVAEYEDEGTKTQYRDAISIDVYSHLADFVAAIEVAQRIWVLRGIPREIYSMTLSKKNFQYKIGQTWTLNAPHFGVNRDFIIIRVTERMQDQKTDLEVWG